MKKKKEEEEEKQEWVAIPTVSSLTGRSDASGGNKVVQSTITWPWEQVLYLSHTALAQLKFPAGCVALFRTGHVNSVARVMPMAPGQDPGTLCCFLAGKDTAQIVQHYVLDTPFDFQRLPLIKSLQLSSRRLCINHAKSASHAKWLATALHGTVVCRGMVLRHTQFDWVRLGQDEQVIVADMNVRVGTITTDTVITVSAPPAKAWEKPTEQWIQDCCALVAGEPTVKRLIEHCSQCLSHTKNRLRKAHCLLVHGAPGTGKTHLVTSVAQSSGRPVFVLQASSFFSKYVGEAESRLDSIIAQSVAEAPSFIILDELDALGRDTLLLSRLAGITEHVIVLATTSRLEAIPNTFFLPGRFDMIFELTNPTPEQRFELLCFLARGFARETKESLRAWSAKLHGFVATDILKFVREAALAGECLETAFLRVEPSSVAEYSFRRKGIAGGVGTEDEKDPFAEVFGLDSTVRRLTQILIEPVTHRARFEQLGLRPPRGVLLYGQSGVGKTLLLRCTGLAASQHGINVLSVQATDLVSKVLGDSQKSIRRIFRLARANSPCLLLLDQIDMLRGEQTLGTFLTEMDGIASSTATTGSEQQLTLVATCTSRKSLHPALVRPGRLEFHIEVPVPNSEGRRKLFERVQLDDDVSIDGLLNMTLGFTGAQVAQLCREASMAALREGMQLDAATAVTFPSRVCARHFATAAATITP